MTKEERLKQALRIAKAKLSKAKCTCGRDKHDEFWIGCELTKAQIEHDNALADAGFVQ